MASQLAPCQGVMVEVDRGRSTVLRSMLRAGRARDQLLEPVPDAGEQSRLRRTNQRLASPGHSPVRLGLRRTLGTLDPASAATATALARCALGVADGHRRLSRRGLRATDGLFSTRRARRLGFAGRAFATRTGRAWAAFTTTAATAAATAACATTTAPPRRSSSAARCSRASLKIEPMLSPSLALGTRGHFARRARHRDQQVGLRPRATGSFCSM